MASQSDALLSNAGRLGSHDTAIIGNIFKGAQYGFSNHLDLLDSATPLTLPPIRPIVAKAPTMFDYVPNMSLFFKNFIERHITAMDGIELQSSNQGAAMSPFADGQSATVPTDTKRSPIAPSVTCQDIIGMGVYWFHQYWLWMIKDPDTSGASLAGVVPASQPLPPHVFSTFSADLAILQYDTTFRPENLIAGYFVTAMWPDDIGPAGFHRQHGETSLPERQITYHGVLQYNHNTTTVGMNIAKILGLHIPNADFANPVLQTIDSRLMDEGLRKEVATAAGAYVPLGDNAAQI